MSNLKPDLIPRSVEAVSQTWLEQALLGGLPLPAFELQKIDANNSSAARLIFADDPPAQHIPRSCILKLCPAGHEFLGASEVNYYSRDYVGLPDAPIPECYQAVWAGGATAQSLGQSYALFLEDLTADHTDHKQIEPVEAHAAELGRALGQLHAYRWGRSADPEGPHDLQSDFKCFLAHVSEGFEPILHELGDTLDAASRARLTKVFDTDADRMLQRAMSGKGITLVHGDPNPTNVLTSKSPHKQRPPLYLIDRQPFQWSLRLWLGASDLVYAVVPFWPEGHRRALQKTLLHSYHQALLANGVQTYSLQDLQEDWEISAGMAAFTAIEWGADPTSLRDMKWLWEKQLRRALIFLKDCDAGVGGVY